jgi:hypothetical protein
MWKRTGGESQRARLLPYILYPRVLLAPKIPGMRIRLCLIALLILSLTACGQKNRSAATDEIVLKIIKSNKVTDNVNQDSVGQDNRDFLSHLTRTATKEELIELTSHPNGVVRCYAFWALAKQKSIDLLPVLIEHINDTEKILERFGDEGGRKRVGDFMIDLANPAYSDGSNKTLDSTESAGLDSILIYSSSQLYAKDKAIEIAQPTERLYPRIRELAVKTGNQSAVVTLAKYRKLQDISVILNNREANSRENEGYFYTYRAIAEFPRLDFMPLLKRNLLQTLGDSHYDNEWSALYRAIAAYKNAESIELLKVPFTRVKYPDIRTYHIGFVFAAIAGINDSIFDELKWSLWADENRIDSNVFRYLYKKNPQKALELAEKFLVKSDELIEADDDDNFDSPGRSKSLTETMLDLVLQKDSAYGIGIIRGKLATADVHLFPTIAWKASEIKDKSFIEPFFKRLGNDDNPYVYLAAARGLISFHSDAINRKILAIRSENKYLMEGWGGKDFTQLLEKNNIN